MHFGASRTRRPAVRQCALRFVIGRGPASRPVASNAMGAEHFLLNFRLCGYDPRSRSSGRRPCIKSPKPRPLSGGRTADAIERRKRAGARSAGRKCQRKSLERLDSRKKMADFRVVFRVVLRKNDRDPHPFRRFSSENSIVLCAFRLPRPSARAQGEPMPITRKVISSPSCSRSDTYSPLLNT